MKKTVTSIFKPLQQHPFSTDPRFTETFSQMANSGYTHYSDISRNGNCFYTATILNLLMSNQKIDFEMCKEKMKILEMDTYIWEEYFERMEEFIEERDEILKQVLSLWNSQKDSESEDFNDRNSDSKHTGGCEKGTSPQGTIVSDKTTSNCIASDDLVNSSTLVDNIADETPSLDYNTGVSDNNCNGSTTAELIDQIEEPKIMEDPVLSSLPFNELTMFFKFLISAEMLKNENLYTPFILNNVKEYIGTSIQPMFRITDFVDIIGLCNALQMDALIFGINGQLEEINHNKKSDVKDESSEIQESNSDCKTEKNKLAIFHNFDHFEPVFKL